MTSENTAKSCQKSQPNPTVNSSIVHKPFATGTINIFNPYRNKSNPSNAQPNTPKLFTNTQLENPPELETESSAEFTQPDFRYRQRDWCNTLFNPWSMSAIAMILLANLISGAVIWRNYRWVSKEKIVQPLANVNYANLESAEFVPLNLSTLSILDTSEDTVSVKATIIEPISPALAPINNTVALSGINSPYHYVLSEYTGDRSLALARQKVKQVSLVNFPQGVFIYLGAFTEREQAEK
ncbi:MAG: hypothetical protein AAGA16_20040, partial [Cyanobacteria bacterium P01_E01_bin.35]